MLKQDGKEFESIDELIDHWESKRTWFEKYIELPFHHKFLNPLRDFYYNLKHLPGNIKRWWPVVWNYRTWDYTFTLHALRTSLEGQLECFYNSKERGWYHVGIDKDIKKIKVCIELLKRMEKNDYCLMEYKVFKNEKTKYKRMRMTEQYDVEYLMKLMKNITHWWD